MGTKVTKTVVQEFTDSYTTKAVRMFHQNCMSSDRLALASPHTRPMSIQLFLAEVKIGLVIKMEIQQSAMERN